MNRNNLVALSILSCVFFFWGFLTAINTILVPYAKGAFDLTDKQSMLIQTVFYSTPLLVCLPTVRLIRAVGYKRSLIFGMSLISIGTLCVIPALYSQLFTTLLCAILVIASGVAMLQVIANPYVISIGSIESAPQRLTIASMINSLGTTVGPYVGAYALFSATPVAAATVMYLLVASMIAVLIVAITLVNLNEPKIAKEINKTTESVLKYPHLFFGIIAIFCYTGAETSVGTFLVGYLTEYAGYTSMAAAQLVSLYWGGAMLGRIIGSVVFAKISPRRILILNTVLAIIVMAFAVLFPGKKSALALVVMGLLNSIMYPVIFSLALSKVGHLKEKASGLLIMAGVGGATIPLVQTFVVDGLGKNISFIIPAACYAFILLYASMLYRDKAV